MNGSLAQKKAPQLALAAAILSAQICLPGLPGLAQTQQRESEPNIVEYVQKQPDSGREIGIADIALIMAIAIAITITIVTTKTVFDLNSRTKKLQEKLDQGEKEKKDIIDKIQRILDPLQPEK